VITGQLERIHSCVTEAEVVNHPTHTLVNACSALQMEPTAVPITFFQLTPPSSPKSPPAEHVYRQVGKCHEEMSADMRVAKKPKMCLKIS